MAEAHARTHSSRARPDPERRAVRRAAVCERGHVRTVDASQREKPSSLRLSYRHRSVHRPVCARAGERVGVEPHWRRASRCKTRWEWRWARSRGRDVARGLGLTDGRVSVPAGREVPLLSCYGGKFGSRGATNACYGRLPHERSFPIAREEAGSISRQLPHETTTPIGREEVR